MATAALPFRHHRRHMPHLAGLARRPAPGRVAGRIALGAAGIALGGFVLYFLKERSQEEAGHHLLESDGAFSLRRYDRLVVAETRSVGTLAEAMDAGYGPLADYIAGKPGARQQGASSRRIAMTVPVMVSPADQSGAWLVRFVMPRGESRTSLPEPAGGVTLDEIAPRTLAAVRFAGRGTDHDLIAGKRERLLDWAGKRGLHIRGEPGFAAYNAPIIPGALRRNEWWVEVASR